VLIGASPVEWSPALIAGSVSDEALAQCRMRWCCDGGGLERAGIVEALGGVRCSIGSTPRCHCFDDATGLARAGGGGGTRGALAWVRKARRLDPIDGLGEVPTPWCPSTEA
jgi:hypothetical protein